MKTAIYASLMHCSSTDKKPMHGKCPEGESSWCFYKRAIAKGETPGSHSSMKTYLSPQVVEKIMPVYQRLASDTILERCVAGKTQNSNESLHSCIWRKCPKEVFVSKKRLEIAVTDAIEKHNLGYVKSLEAKEDSCLNDSFSLTIAERQDKRRISQNISTKQKGKRNATNTNAAYSAALKRLDPLILEDKPEDLTRKDEMDWITKNSDAIAPLSYRLQMSKPYSSRRKTTRKCCGIKLERLTWAKKQEHSPSTSQRNNSSRNGHVFTASHREEKPCDNIWILIVVHPVIWLKNLCGSKNISPEVMDIYLADKNSKMMSQGTGNVSAKTVSTKHCNSINLTITDVSYVPQLRCNLLSVTCLMDKGLNQNGKAERANRVLLERARSLLYESKLPLKFWAEAINCSTQVSNVTPRKGKEKIPLEIWTGNKPKLNYLKKFGCVAYFHVPKVLRNKFEVPGRRGIMLGYARERRGYRIYDIKNQKVIEERSVKFNEYLKGSNYLGEIENETWDIDSFFEVSPERNEINQNTENGVLYNFDINNEPGAIENNSIPFKPRHHLGQAESKFRYLN
ncbi:retrovirus-related Pol polyprotein from transposon TNT 1-94 [Trichonephila clavipes]|nr:retrovirus-related Pol polyprotein from transposon TNT 1-94 [Trichonephila clavipes]